MPRITLKDGRWVDLRLPTTDEWLLLLDNPDVGQDDTVAFIARVREYRDVFNAACLGTSWGGKPSDLDPTTLSQLVAPFLNATEDDAVPPESGTDSGTTSPEPSSATTDAP